jgi:hypothetical protein
MGVGTLADFRVSFLPSNFALKDSQQWLSELLMSLFLWRQRQRRCPLRLWDDPLTGLRAVQGVRRASFYVSTLSTFQTFGILGFVSSGVSIWLE